MSKNNKIEPLKEGNCITDQSLLLSMKYKINEIVGVINNPPEEELRIKELIALDPSKIYILKISETHDTLNDLAFVEKEIQDIKRKYGIVIIAITKGLDFIDPPEGYEVKKINE